MIGHARGLRANSSGSQARSSVRASGQAHSTQPMVGRPCELCGCLRTITSRLACAGRWMLLFASMLVLLSMAWQWATLTSSHHHPTQRNQHATSQPADLTTIEMQVRLWTLTLTNSTRRQPASGDDTSRHTVSWDHVSSSLCNELKNTQSCAAASSAALAFGWVRALLLVVIVCNVVCVAADGAMSLCGRRCQCSPAERGWRVTAARWAIAVCVVSSCVVLVAASGVGWYSSATLASGDTLQRYVSLHSWFSATWDVSSVTAAQPMLVCGLGFQVFAALLFSSGVSHMSMPTAGSDTLPLVVDADMEDPGQKHRGE